MTVTHSGGRQKGGEEVKEEITPYRDRGEGGRHLRKVQAHGAERRQGRQCHGDAAEFGLGGAEGRDLHQHVEQVVHLWGAAAAGAGRQMTSDQRCPDVTQTQ